MTLRLSRHFLRTGARLLAFALLYGALSPVLASLLPGDRASGFAGHAIEQLKGS